MSSPFAPQCSSAPFATLALAASLSAASLLAGCDTAAGKTRSLDPQLAAVMADYAAVTTSHIAEPGVKNVAYNADTVRGENWKDLSVEASRQDQYASLTKRLDAIADAPGASAQQKAIVSSLLADIHIHSARFQAQRAQSEHSVLGARLVVLQDVLGQIESIAVVRANNTRQVQTIIPLIEEGQAGQSMGLTDLIKAEAEAKEAVKATEDKLATTTAVKAAARTKADALFAKASDLQLAVRRTQGLERFDVVDQASTTLCEAEQAEAEFSGVDQELVALKHELTLRIAEQKALADTIENFEERLKAAKQTLETADSDAATSDQEMDKLHVDWVAKAKALDALETEKVDARFADALSVADQAGQVLAKGLAGAGKDAQWLPAHEVVKAGLATDIARYQLLRLQALESHRQALDSLAKREAVWLPAKADPFFAARVAALAKQEAALAKTALGACSEASTAVDDASQKGSEKVKSALGGVQASLMDYRKNIQAIRQTLGDGSAVAEPPAKVETAEAAPPAETPAPAGEE